MEQLLKGMIIAGDIMSCGEGCVGLILIKLYTILELLHFGIKRVTLWLLNITFFPVGKHLINIFTYNSLDR